jgi:hypothetical protein
VTQDLPAARPAREGVDDAGGGHDLRDVLALEHHEVRAGHDVRAALVEEHVAGDVALAARVAFGGDRRDRVTSGDSFLVPVSLRTWKGVAKSSKLGP